MSILRILFMLFLATTVTIEIHASDMELIKESNSHSQEDSTSIRAFEFGKTQGFLMASSMGMHFNPNTGNSKLVSLSLQHTFAYQLNDYLIVGLGFGVEHYDYLIVPTFLDLRFNLGKSDHTMFLVSKIGYSHPWASNDDYRSYDGGFYQFTGFGYRSKFTEAMAIEFTMGYKYQQLKTIDNANYWWGGDLGQTTNTTYNYSRLEMRLGLFIR